MYSFCAMYSFRMSFWMVPETFLRSAPCFSATARYIAHRTDAGELMVIETVVFSRSMPSKRISMSSSESMATPHLPTSPSQVRRCHRFALADLAFAERMVAVVAHQRGQIEGDRESMAAVLQQIFIPLVGFLGRGEARELAHGPHLAAIARGMNAARKRRLARIVQILFVRPVGGKIGGRIQAANRQAGDGGEPRVAVLVEVDACGRADGLFGSLLQRRRERILGPLLFGLGRMTASFEEIGDRRFG